MKSEKPKKTKARRGRGEGSVQQRPDGSWQGQISLGVTANGKRRRKFVNAPTKFECLELLAQKRAEHGQGTVISGDATTVAGFLDRWTTAISKSASEATIDSYKRNIRIWINPGIGHIRIQKLDILTVEQFVSHVASKKSKRLAQYNRAILRHALKDAVRWGVIKTNVVDAVKAPAPDDREFQVWDEAQTNKALGECKTERLGGITAIGLLCGMRQGEILALQWADIDLKNCRIHVRRTQSYTKGKVVLKSPKTKAGNRTIEFSESLSQILHDHKARMMQEGWLKQPFVFVNEVGEMLDRFGQAKSSFKRITAAAGNPEMGFHCTRHTHATLLLRAGVSPKVVQERLGHSTVTITLNIYSHVIPAMQSEAVAKLDKLLG